MNTELLEKIAAHIEAHPEGFDMQYFANECGTTCCIAGEAVRMTAPPREFSKLLRRYWGQRSEDSGFHERGRNALEISDREGFRLFYVGGWPHQFQDAYRLAEHDGDAAGAAKAGAARLRHFIKTEGAE